jgi:CBS domain-containing protein
VKRHRNYGIILLRWINAAPDAARILAIPVWAQLVEGSVRQLSDIICNQHPLTLTPSCSVSDACRQMRDRRVGAVLITNEAGRLLGIFTGRDAVTRIVAAGKSPTKTKLGDVMTPDPVTMSQNKTAIEALRLMWDGGFRHIPLVEDYNVVGIVSRGDFKASEEDRFEEERGLWEHMR